MRRGEVRWYKFAGPADKRRPVLVLTRDSAIEFLREITIAPITSTIRDIPTEVVLSEHDGMIRECAINCDHLQTVPKSKLGGLIASLPASKMTAVAGAIRNALELEE